MLGVTWRPEARRQFTAIIDYIAERDRGAAKALRDRILEAVERARHFPLMHREGRVDGTREIVAHANYLVVYAILPDRLRIVAVVHARQQYP